MHAGTTQVYVRRGRLLLALSGVQRAIGLAGADHPAVHKAVVRFCQKRECALRLPWECWICDTMCQAAPL